MQKTIFNTIPDAINSLKMGQVIIICDDENRENEGDFVALSEHVTPEMINFMITHGRGLLCMPISSEIADKFKLIPMVTQNTDNFATAFTVSVDHKTNSTGISAFDRYTTIKEFNNPEATHNDFRRPGHIFPLTAKAHGVLERAGHTEATVDLARLCGSNPVGIICEIINEDGTMSRRDQLIKIAKQFNLKIITIKDLIHYRKCNDKLVTCEAITNLPTKFGNFSIYGYASIIDKKEIAVIVKGNPKNFVEPFVRVHSECLTGDAFHSLRCDCGEQLEMSLKTLEAENQGLIIYLPQEGRGIGLINKLKAYELQQNGFDTFDANIELGFEADGREYFVATQILKDLNINTVRLATNNPHKINELEKFGIVVKNRISVKPTSHAHNINYLETKIKKFGHLL